MLLTSFLILLFLALAAHFLCKNNLKLIFYILYIRIDSSLEVKQILLIKADSGD